MSTNSSHAMDDDFEEDREENKQGVIQEKSSKKALTREAANALMNEYLHAPEDETRDNVDLKDLDVTQFVSTLQKEVAHWEKIWKVSSVLKPEDSDSWGKFAILYIRSYSDLKNEQDTTAVMNFFLSPESLPYLRKCFKYEKSKHEKISNIELLQCNIYFVIITTSLNQQLYEQTETALLKATALRPQETILYFNNSIQTGCFEGLTPKVSSSHFKKVSSLYEKALKFAGFTEEKYDVNDLSALTILNYHAGKSNEVIKHGNRALKLKPTSPENKKYAMQIDMQNLREAIIEAYRLTKNFAEAKKMYLSGPISEQAAFCLALIYREEKDWSNAYHYFQLSCPEDTIGFYFSDRNQIFLFLGLLLDLKEYVVKNKKEEKSNFFKRFEATRFYLEKNKFSDLKEDIVKFFDWREKRKIGAFIKKILATEKFSNCKKIMSNFDQKYKSVWFKTSEIPEFQDPVYLKLVDEVNELSALIEEAYVPLKELSTENFEKNFQLISTSHDSLESLFRIFKDKADKVCSCVKDERMRLALLEAEKPTPSSYNEAPVTNLKKEYRLEKEKEKEKESSDAPRIKHDGTSLGRDQPPIEQENVSKLGTGKLRSFSKQDRSAQGIWNSRNDNPDSLSAFDRNALDLMESLNQACSIYHLWKLVPSRTKLEKLHGDMEGQLALRINDEYRLSFRWVTREGAYDVKITKHYKKVH